MRREAADPERGRRDVHPVGDLRLPRRTGVDGVVARDREPADEHRARSRAPARAARPGRAATRGRRARARARTRASSRRTPDRIASARSERGRRRGSGRTSSCSASSERSENAAIPACSASTAPAPAATARFRSSCRGTCEPTQHDQPQPERADRQCEPDEPEPADDVLGRCRAAGAVRRRDGRRRDADAERPDAGDDVRVGRDRVPPNGVRAHLERAARSRSGRCRCTCDPPGEVVPDAVQDPDRAGQQLHVLVERSRIVPGPRCSSMPKRGLVDRSVACADATAGNASATNSGGEERSHRCGAPASRREVAEDRRDVAVGEQLHRRRPRPSARTRSEAPRSSAARSARAGRTPSR